METALEAVLVKRLGIVEYAPALEAMRGFTAQRTESTPDEIWVLEHPAVYTFGLGADQKHGPRVSSRIPVVQVERGGEITYHGPGQAVVYTLIDLSRRGLKVKPFVALLEQSVIDFLAKYQVRAERKPGAPGVYVDGSKIAALGIRLSKGRSYHGLALNVDMDLSPYSAIDPCGQPGLAVTQAKDLGIQGSALELGEKLAQLFARRLEDA